MMPLKKEQEPKIVLLSAELKEDRLIEIVPTIWQSRVHT